MPFLNEAETLETCIRKAQDFLSRSGVDGEVLIGDNGSTDGSQEIARRCGARVVDVPVRGYGAALHHATLAARGRYIIMGDSDDSYDFTNLMPFLERLRGGDDLVMGNRFQGGIQAGAMPWKNRYIGNPVLSGVGRLFFKCPSQDFHCGLRGYSAQAYRRMDLRTTGMEYASEMVIKSTLLGLNISVVASVLVQLESVVLPGSVEVGQHQAWNKNLFVVRQRAINIAGALTGRFGDWGVVHPGP